MKVVVVGGGWAGCAAALQARRRGAETLLIERTDMLLGTGLVGGIMRNNGRWTAAEEMIALGGGELFRLADRNALHADIAFPGHPHASLYNVATMEPLVRALLLERGVEVLTGTRIDAAGVAGGRLRVVSARRGERTARFEADAFVDATGTAGPTANCVRHGNGCVMCILRCPAFGGRVSLTALCGVTEIVGRKGEQVGAMSGSCKLNKDSLAPHLVRALAAEGVAVVPVPAELRAEVGASLKACQQYALPEFSENLVVLDTGHAKLMVPFFPLEALRRVPGFERARYEDPYAGGSGNSVRYLGMSPRDDALRVAGVAGLFCAGEKAGLLVGHTEAIVTGTLAGHNAAAPPGEPPLVLPRELAVGDAIAHVRERMAGAEGLGLKFTFSGSVYFQRLKQLGLYTTDAAAIAGRVQRAGLAGVFSA